VTLDRFTIWQDRGGAHAPDAGRGGQRLVFGPDTLYLAPGDEQPAEHVARVAAGTNPDRLHLVVQVGNRFQAEHPHVPVLYSRGRYVLVDLDPTAADAHARTACYSVKPLRAPAVIFEERQRAARRERRADIATLLDTISGPRLLERVQKLVDLTTRESTSGGFRQAAANAKATFEDLGYQVDVTNVPVGSKRSNNVIAERLGTGPAPRDVVIVTAHLDSVNHETPGGNAPGADDNGSGAAGVMEIAECLAEVDRTSDLRFILFGGEEQGLFGSTAYVQGLAPQHRISGVINMDMVAAINTAARSVLIEGGPVSQSLIDRLVATAETYTDLAVQTSLHFFNSDHVPFINAGIPAVLLIEGNDSANTTVHTARDTMDRLDVPLMTAIVRMNMAAVLELTE
jgi:hypothetical protein